MDRQPQGVPPAQSASSGQGSAGTFDTGMSDGSLSSLGMSPRGVGASHVVGGPPAVGRFHRPAAQRPQAVTSPLAVLRSALGTAPTNVWQQPQQPAQPQPQQPHGVVRTPPQPPAVGATSPTPALRHSSSASGSNNGNRMDVELASLGVGGVDSARDHWGLGATHASTSTTMESSMPRDSGTSAVGVIGGRTLSFTGRSGVSTSSHPLNATTNSNSNSSTNHSGNSNTTNPHKVGSEVTFLDIGPQSGDRPEPRRAPVVVQNNTFNAPPNPGLSSSNPAIPASSPMTMSMEDAARTGSWSSGSMHPSRTSRMSLPMVPLSQGDSGYAPLPPPHQQAPQQLSVQRSSVSSGPLRRLTVPTNATSPFGAASPVVRSPLALMTSVRGVGHSSTGSNGRDRADSNATSAICSGGVASDLTDAFATHGVYARFPWEMVENGRDWRFLGRFSDKAVEREYVRHMFINTEPRLFVVALFVAAVLAAFEAFGNGVLVAQKWPIGVTMFLSAVCAVLAMVLARIVRQRRKIGQYDGLVKSFASEERVFLVAALVWAICSVALPTHIHNCVTEDHERGQAVAYCASGLRCAVIHGFIGLVLFGFGPRLHFGLPLLVVAAVLGGVGWSVADATKSVTSTTAPPRQEHLFFFCVVLLALAVLTALRDVLRRNAFRRSIDAYLECRERESHREKFQAFAMALVPTTALFRILYDERVVDTSNEATIVFVNLMDFLEWTRWHSAAHLGVVMHSVAATLIQRITETGLDLVEMLGDSCVASCGLTCRIENHVLRACTFGLSVERLLHDAVQVCGGHQLQASIGIHTGPALGMVVPARTQYDVFGASIAIAEQVALVASACQVLASATTHNYIKNNSFFVCAVTSKSVQLGLALDVSQTRTYRITASPQWDPSRLKIVPPGTTPLPGNITAHPRHRFLLDSIVDAAETAESGPGPKQHVSLLAGGAKKPPYPQPPTLASSIVVEDDAGTAVLVFAKESRVPSISAGGGGGGTGVAEGGGGFSAAPAAADVAATDPSCDLPGSPPSAIRRYSTGSRGTRGSMNLSEFAAAAALSPGGAATEEDERALLRQLLDDAARSAEPFRASSLLCCFGRRLTLKDSVAETNSVVPSDHYGSYGAVSLVQACFFAVLAGHLMYETGPGASSSDARRERGTVAPSVTAFCVVLIAVALITGLPLARFRLRFIAVDVACMVAPWTMLLVGYAAVDFHRHVVTYDPLTNRLLSAVCMASTPPRLPWFAFALLDCFFNVLPNVTLFIAAGGNNSAWAPTLESTILVAGISMLLWAVYYCRKRGSKAVAQELWITQRLVQATDMECSMYSALAHHLFPASVAGNVMRWYLDGLKGDSLVFATFPKVVVLQGKVSVRNIAIDDPRHAVTTIAAFAASLAEIADAKGKSDSVMAYRTNGDTFQLSGPLLEEPSVQQHVGAVGALIEAAKGIDRLCAELRLGLKALCNIGDVSAGVVGTARFSYGLFGELPCATMRILNEAIDTGGIFGTAAVTRLHAQYVPPGSDVVANALLPPSELPTPPPKFGYPRSVNVRGLGLVVFSRLEAVEIPGTGGTFSGCGDNEGDALLNDLDDPLDKSFVPDDYQGHKKVRPVSSAALAIRLTGTVPFSPRRPSSMDGNGRDSNPASGHSTPRSLSQSSRHSDPMDGFS